MKVSIDYSVPMKRSARDRARTQRPRLASVGALVFLTLTACPADETVWIAPNSSLSNLEFFVGSAQREQMPKLVSQLTVARCDPPGVSPARVVWQMKSDSLVLVEKIRYGVPASGAYSSVQPQTLAVDSCYRVQLHEKVASFVVDKSGAIREVSNQTVR